MTLAFKNLKKGITLIEVSIAIFFIVLFSLIIIADFPKILRQSALSRVTYKLAQDLRRAQDLGLSGVIIKDANGEKITVEGYGIYVNTPPVNQYVIYADVPDGGGSFDQKYSGGLSYPRCDQVNQGVPITSPLITDCVIEVVDVKDENPSLSIDKLVDNSNSNSIGYGASINFKPPNPTINIEDNQAEQSNTYSGPGVKIVLRNTDGFTRAVSINSSGLIEVQ